MPPLDTRQLLAMPSSDYMNDIQREFFRQLLLEQRQTLQQRISEEFADLREAENHSDLADQGSAEEARQWRIRQLEREKRLLDKIDQALARLVNGEYGWCSETGEPIGLQRLLLRPTTHLCIEAKQRQELQERHIRHARFSD